MAEEIDVTDLLVGKIVEAGMPEPVREHYFALPRRWRFDLAFPDYRVAIEIEGGVYVAGRHARGAGYEKDTEKYNTATVLGWLVLRFTTSQIKRALIPPKRPRRRKTKPVEVLRIIRGTLERSGFHVYE